MDSFGGKGIISGEDSMLRSLIATGAIVFAASHCSADNTYYGETFDKRFAVTVTTEQLSKSPSWKDDSDNPLVPAKKAIKLATEIKDKLVKDNDEEKWKLHSASLYPSTNDKWFWLITFELHFIGGGLAGGVPTVHVIVLMDGTVIGPDVTDR